MENAKVGKGFCGSLLPKWAGREAAGGAVIAQAALGQAGQDATVGLLSRQQPD